MVRVRILILEDDTKTLLSILSVLDNLEKNIDFSITILPDYQKVDKYINHGEEKYDVVLLDRDCKLGGSFHILDLSRFDIEKIIAISSVPDYNQQLATKGVKYIVGKDYSNLKDFELRLRQILSSMLINKNE